MPIKMSASKSEGNAGRYNNSTLEHMVFMNKRLFDRIKPLIKSSSNDQDADESKDTTQKTHSENLTDLLETVGPLIDNKKSNNYKELTDFEMFLKYKDLMARAMNKNRLEKLKNPNEIRKYSTTIHTQTKPLSSQSQSQKSTTSTGTMATDKTLRTAIRSQPKSAISIGDPASEFSANGEYQPRSGNQNLNIQQTSSTAPTDEASGSEQFRNLEDLAHQSIMDDLLTEKIQKSFSDDDLRYLLELPSKRPHTRTIWNKRDNNVDVFELSQSEQQTGILDDDQSDAIKDSYIPLVKRKKVSSNKNSSAVDTPVKITRASSRKTNQPLTYFEDGADNSGDYSDDDNAGYSNTASAVSAKKSRQKKITDTFRIGKQRVASKKNSEDQSGSGINFKYKKNPIKWISLR